MTYSTSTAVHSAAEAGGHDAMGLQDAEFFTNMAVPWILLAAVRHLAIRQTCLPALKRALAPVQCRTVITEKIYQD